MVKITPFDQCVARPDQGAKKYLLVDHLANVAKASGSPTGEPLARCKFLAGLVHDVGKAQWQWQQYADNPQQAETRVNHAFMGAAVFFLLADYLYRPQLQCNENNLTDMVLNLTRDIANHHGSLNDLNPTEPPWQFVWQDSALDYIDWHGLWQFVCGHLPEICPPWLADTERIRQKVKQSRKTWFRYCALMEENRLLHFSEAAKNCLRTNTGQLIAADRFDAGGLEIIYLEQNMTESAVEKLNLYCHQKGGVSPDQVSGSMASRRQYCREQATKTYLKHPGKLFYQLQLPTGLGKTITGLNVALWACNKHQRQRIIYVAPYLSIIDQAAHEIEKATGLEVLQHHSMAVAQKEQFDQKDHLIMESWQAPVVVTSFNQFFTGLFPGRAQQTMRLNAMEKAFVIIDEPQIIDHGAWNLFLIMLQALARERDMQVLLMSATMPPLDILPKKPYPLVQHIPTPDRYRVCIKPNQYEKDQLARQVLQDCRQHGSVAAILNTVADCANLYTAITKPDHGDLNCFNLHGAMHPLHKKCVIAEIKNSLAQGQPTLAITTQIIEAGVDLSFQSLWRERPLLPSVSQAAGRSNRHGAQDMATVKIFDYVRDGRLTRHWVYKDPIAREETDNLLNQQTDWSERQLNQLVTLFYQNYFQRQPGYAALELIIGAAAGAWGKLAGINPFPDAGFAKIPVFVPVGEQWGDRHLAKLMDEFNLQSIDEIYEKYIMPGWFGQLSFIQRKRFMALLQQFVVPVGDKLAKRISTRRSQRRWINYVNCLDDYSLKTGFGHLVSAEQDNAYII